MNELEFDMDALIEAMREDHEWQLEEWRREREEEMA